MIGEKRRQGKYETDVVTACLSFGDLSSPRQQIGDEG